MMPRVLPEDADVDAAVTAEIRQLHQGGHLEVRAREPRCRICSDEPTRQLVNRLLGHMLRPADIWDILEGSVNPRRRSEGLKSITVRGIRTHARQHFDVDHPARVAYRRMGERRARQLGKDYENGINGALTHLLFLDVVMQKGFENLTDADTVVDYREGMRAAIQLAEIERRDSGAQQHAEALAQMNHIISVIKDTLPEDQWALFIAKLRGQELPSTRQALPPGDDDDDEAWDPGEDSFDDDRIDED